MFLLMAIVVGLHGFEIFYLGPQGWTWLAISVGAGGFLAWWVPERAWDWRRGAFDEMMALEGPRSDGPSSCLLPPLFQ